MEGAEQSGGGAILSDLLEGGRSDGWSGQADLRELALRLENEMEVHVFLRDDISASMQATIEEDLTDLVGEEGDVTYESKAMAIELARQRYAAYPDLLAALSADNIPASFIVHGTAEQIASIAARFESRPGVEQVEVPPAGYVRDVERFFIVQCGPEEAQP